MILFGQREKVKYKFCNLLYKSLLVEKFLTVLMMILPKSRKESALVCLNRGTPRINVLVFTMGDGGYPEIVKLL